MSDPIQDQEEPSADEIETFIDRWRSADGTEKANYQIFFTELCELLRLPKPEPAGADDGRNAYVFERRVDFLNPDGTSSRGFIDCYRRRCFVGEAKQTGKQIGSGVWDAAMLSAQGQAVGYARALPSDEGRPPFVLVADVGRSIELYSEFTCTGGAYIPFPDPRSHRIRLEALRDPPIRDRLRRVWLEPLSLDPTRQSARVTREIADRLAVLARSLEQSGHPAQAVGAFLMRCIFTMFAEDIGLLPKRGFTDLLESLRDNPELFAPLAEELWRAMNGGGFSATLRTRLLRFNGGLFADAAALPLDREQLRQLIDAARADWRHVEPTIFGTLLERALDPTERHKLGAHYTPRPYVERLVIPTVIDPLRQEWENVQAAALTLDRQGKTKAAADEIDQFHHRLCAVRVLDPACGSVNFLYVTLEHMKRLEGEVLNALEALTGQQTRLETEGLAVDPHQFLGIEINPRAAAIAEAVLWIGYLQWHYRTRGNVAPPEPVLREFHNIECRDAVLAWDAIEPVLDADGQPLTRWDGRTLKRHPVTGEEVPDENARVPVVRYINPRKAEWPEADFVVGNPPFIGAGRMRQALGDGYAEALRSVWPEVPESADFVMYWWHKAATLARAGRIRRFGLITTNSLRQTFNRRVIQAHLSPSSLSASASLRENVLKEAHAEAQRRGEEEMRMPLSPSSLRAFASSRENSSTESHAKARRREEEKLEKLMPLSLLYAIPDHPWVDSGDGAAVRIAMSIGAAGEQHGRLETLVAEGEGDGEGRAVTLKAREGKLFADLKIGADVAGCGPLRANGGISSPGVKLHGAGFIVTREEAARLGLGRIPGLERHIREYRNGRDLTQSPRDALVIDLFGLAAEEVRSHYPEVYQWVVERVKPERDAKGSTKDGAGYARLWWLFGKPRQEMRPALAGLPHYIATVETSKHRFFVFLDQSILPDNMLVNIALADGYTLGVLSSRLHIAWALATGGRLGMGNDPRYNKSRCFETFAFPEAAEPHQAKIRHLAEQIDAHRKRQQALHPDLTLTGIYNVLEQLRREQPLTAKEKGIHEQGLVSVLRQLHDELDAAVFEAYGWGDLANPLVGRPGATTPYPDKPEPQAEAEEELLRRLVELNAQRSMEEQRGQIRWLRPEYQNPGQGRAAPSGEQMEADLKTDEAAATPAGQTIRDWPKGLPEQVQALREALRRQPGPATPDQLARLFKRARADRVTELLETLRALGQARRDEEGRYSGA